MKQIKKTHIQKNLFLFVWVIHLLYLFCIAIGPHFYCSPLTIFRHVRENKVIEFFLSSLQILKS